MADNSRQESGVMNQVAVAVAQQNAMARGGRTLQHGSRLFMIDAGWESEVMRRDASVAQADTLLTLEAALRAPEVKVILIPHDALITDDDIDRLSQRNGATKTLFRETKKT